MKRLTLIISGKVQQAGYRDKIIEYGRSLDLKGHAENLPDGRVKVVAEGEERNLELLKERADIKNTLINVEKIESSYSEAIGEFSGFFKLVRGGETDERLDTAADYLKKLIEVTQNGFSQTLEKQDKMLEKQDKMLEKQDTAVHVLNKISDDTSNMKSTLTRIEIDVRDTKFSLSSFIEEKFQKQEKEIAEIKAALARMQEAG